MDGTQLIALLDLTLDRLAESTDELRDLDAALGDGDLGITVGAGAAAVREAWRQMPTDPPPAPADVVKVAAAAFAKANPSTFAALVGGALLAGARGLVEVERLDRDAAIGLARAAADSIATRGKTKIGDKTVLDALVPAVEAMAAAPDGEALAAGIGAAREGVRSTTDQQSMKGRASWLGERSKGLQDPGATAFLRFLEALEHAHGTEEHS